MNLTKAFHIIWMENFYCLVYKNDHLSLNYQNLVDLYEDHKQLSFF